MNYRSTLLSLSLLPVSEQGLVILVQVFHIIYFLWIIFNNLKYITIDCYYPNLRYDSMTKEWFI